MNKQQQNHRLRMDSSRSHWGGGGCAYIIFILDSDFVNTQQECQVVLNRSPEFLFKALLHMSCDISFPTMWQTQTRASTASF